MQILYSTALRGIQDAVRHLKKGADRIHRGEITEGMLEMTRAVRQAQANMTTLRISERLSKSWLDIYG